jgi:hypothetical protein
VYRSNKNNSSFARKRRFGSSARRSRGAITPFIAMAVILMMGMVGVCIDLNRDFETARQLKFAAQSAALYGLSLTTNINGTYSPTTAMTNIQNAVQETGNNAWNVAEFGPVNNSVTSNPQAGISSKPVTFANTDVQFVANPLDPTETFVQVTANRHGADALQQFFLPLLYTSFNGPAPQSARIVPTHRVVEVLGEPATRIGAGAPLNSPIGSREAQLAGFATLPLAISYNQFAALTNPALTTNTYTIDLVTSQSNGATAAGHIKGCFVNVSSTGNGAVVYNSAQGNKAVNQLLGLLSYFGAQSAQPTLAPAVVERGSFLNAFDPAQWTAAQQKSISQTLTSLLQVHSNGAPFIMPVLQTDPSFVAVGQTGANQVVGFANLTILSFASANGVPASVTVSIAPSIPVRNATTAVMASVTNPAGVSQLMPAPPASTAGVIDPFLPRTYDPIANTVAVRARGIVMAPALSPRQVPTF